MRILFTTQSSGLKLFYNMLLSLEQKVKIDAAGFYVADSGYYERFTAKNRDFPGRGYLLLKEWDIISEAGRKTADIQVLRQYEKNIGQPYLWNAVVADRRICQGKNYRLTQDYKPRYSHEEMLSILET